MKKTLYIATLTLLCLLFAACKEYLDPVPIDTKVSPDSVAYLRINVSSLSDGSDQAATRAAEGANYQNGDEPDYRINKAWLLLFKGAAGNDKGSRFHSIYSLLRSADAIDPAESPVSGDGETEKEDQVTRSFTRVVPVKDFTLDTGEKFYAYVIANCDPLTQMGQSLAVMNWVVDGPKKISSDLTFEEFSKWILQAPGGAGNIVMTNAPMATATTASAAKIEYMPAIDETKIYRTREAAAKNPAVDVFVERALCKVTVKDSKDTPLTGQLDATDLTTEGREVRYDIDNIRWSTDNRNMSFYNVRQLEQATGSGGYIDYRATEHSGQQRFIDTKPVAEGVDRYRVFWAEDINYTFPHRNSKSNEGNESNQGPEMGPNIGVLVATGDTLFNFDNPLGGSDYCRENTMSAEYMTQDKTTRVYVRVPFIIGKDEQGNDVEYEGFYTLPSEDPDKIYYRDDTRCKGVDDRKFSKRLMEYITDLTEYKQWKTNYGITATDENIIKLTIMDEDGYLKTTDSIKKPIYEIESNFFGGNMDSDGKPIRENHKRRLVQIEGMDDLMNDMSTTNDNMPAPVYEEVDGKKYLVVGEIYDLNQDGRTLYDEDGNGKNDVGESLVWANFGDARVLVRYNPAVVTAQAAQDAFRDLQLTDRVNLNLQMNYYPLGFAYYPVRIRHFSDDEVNDFVPNRTQYTDVYPGSETERARNYLGRYGMVRNTWYEISLTGIRHIGWSKGYDPDPVPDDESESYMSAKVYVNRWAKHEQEDWLK